MINTARIIHLYECFPLKLVAEDLVPWKPFKEPSGLGGVSDRLVEKAG